MRTLLLALCLSTASAFASDASTFLHQASLDSVTLLRSFVIPANSKSVYFGQGQPTPSISGEGYCAVAAEEASPHDREVGGNGLPKTVASAGLKYQELSNGVHMTTLALKGKTLNAIVCVSFSSPSTVGDFQKAFGDYLRLDLHPADPVDPAL